MKRVDPPIEWTGTGNKTEDDLALENFAFLQTLPQIEGNLRSSGLFWNKLEDVWDTSAFMLSGNEFSLICRPEMETSCYNSCYMYVENGEIRESAAGSSSGRTPGINTDNDLKLDAFGNTYCEKAHLIPHADLCYKAYGFLAEAAVGKVVANKEERLKILKGVKNVHNSSLKSHKNNKMFLKGQKEFYDVNPSFLVVPILDITEVKDWAIQSRTSYEVMALTFGKKHRQTSKEVLKDALLECTPHDIEAARKLLSIFLTGIAWSLVEKEVYETFTAPERKNTLIEKWSKTVDDLRERGTVMIPKRKTLHTEVHVAKARVSIGNSLPDPWLLTMKAAINYSSYYEQKLMPACVCTNSDTDSDDEFSMTSTPSIAFDNCRTGHHSLGICHQSSTTQGHKEGNLCGKIIEFRVSDVDNNDECNLEFDELACDT